LCSSTDSIISFSSMGTRRSTQPPSRLSVAVVAHPISHLTAQPASWRNPGTPMNPHEDSIAVAARLWYPWLRIDRLTRVVIADA
jgi:hypothetical protein